MTFDHLAKATFLLAASVVVALAADKSLAGPETGMFKGDGFLSDKDAVCALGNDLSKGCEAVRRRDIVDASQNPWKSIGRVNYAGIQLRSHCTGTLVSEHLVLTASHCLYDYRRKSWLPAQSIRFVAGYQRGEAEAVSLVSEYILDPVHDVGSRDFRAAPGQDWALLVLQSPIGRDVGFLNPVDLSPDKLRAADVFLAGYAGLRPHVLSVATDCGSTEPRPEAMTIVQRCTAMQGDSGGPLFTLNEGEVQVIGVLSGVAIRPSGTESIGIPVSVFHDALRSALDDR